jgi:hypothetical protein
MPQFLFLLFWNRPSHRAPVEAALGLVNGKWESTVREIRSGRRAVKDQTPIENNLTHVCLLLLLILQTVLPVDETQNKG